MEFATQLASIAFGPENPQMSVAYDNLATAYEDVGRLSEAEALYRKAIYLDSKAPDANADMVATHLSNLGRLLKRRGDLANGEALYRQSIELLIKNYGPNYPTEAFHLVNLGALLIVKKDYAGAQEALDRAPRIYESSGLGLDHPKASALFSQRADLAEKTGNPKEAEVLYKRSLQILMRTEGPDAPDTRTIQAEVDRLEKQQAN
jgi:tetratricopeptide (TPR) repeat protein